MNFAEAWALLLDGKRIRRASWSHEYFWFLSGGRVMEAGPQPDAKVTGATDDELLATDWEEQ